MRATRVHLYVLYVSLEKSQGLDKNFTYIANFAVCNSLRNISLERNEKPPQNVIDKGAYINLTLKKAHYVNILHLRLP